MNRAALLICASFFVAGCGRSHDAVVRIALDLKKPTADAATTRANIETRLRRAGGAAVKDVTIADVDAGGVAIDVGLSLNGSCSGLGELATALKGSLTRPGRLGFYRAAGEAGQRQLDALAKILPEGALRADEHFEGARRSHLEPDELRRAIGILPEATGVLLALEDVAPDPSQDTARVQRIWALESPPLLDRRAIETASTEIDDLNGMPNVMVEFNQPGAATFGEVTESLVGRILVIVLDGEVVSAPKVMEPIRGGRATINIGARSPKTALLETQGIAAALSTPELAGEVRVFAAQETCLME